MVGGVYRGLIWLFVSWMDLWVVNAVRWLDGWLYVWLERLSDGRMVGGLLDIQSGFWIVRWAVRWLDGLLVGLGVVGMLKGLLDGWRVC